MLATLLAILLAGCSFSFGPPYQHDVTLPARGNLAPLLIQLFDQSGTVDRLEIPLAAARGPDIAGGGSVVEIPGRPDAVLLVWVGGACDERVDIEYTGGDTTFSGTTLTDGLGCDAIGIVRSVVVVFTTPVDAGTFRVLAFQ